jgi:preprotein translocase subunit SecB
MSEAKQPEIRLVNVFLATTHFEHHADYLKIPSSTKVEVGFSMTVTVAGANDGKASIITIAIKTRDDPEALYRFHVELTGIMEGDMTNPDAAVQEHLTKQGAAMLFPFLREAVANLTGRGHFGAIWLKPFDTATMTLQTQDAAAAE